MFLLFVCKLLIIDLLVWILEKHSRDVLVEDTSTNCWEHIRCMRLHAWLRILPLISVCLERYLLQRQLRQLIRWKTLYTDHWWSLLLTRSKRDVEAAARAFLQGTAYQNTSSRLQESGIERCIMIW